VAAIVADRDPRVRAEYAELVPHLDRLHELYQILRTTREQRGAMDFDIQETVIEYGADRKIERILPTERNDAHRLIEECMISANVAAARFLQRHKVPGLYRVHEGPTEDRLNKLRAFLGELGLGLSGGDKPGLSGGDKPSPLDYTRLLDRICDRPDAHLIQTVAFAGSSGLQSQQCRPFRPGARGVCALYLADSPLSRSSGASRYSSCAERG